jgi:hypothetical protein
MINVWFGQEVKDLDRAYVSYLPRIKRQLTQFNNYEIIFVEIIEQYSKRI